MNEVNNYKQGVMSYYAAKGKLSGDTNNTGIIGVDSGNNIEIDGSSFGGVDNQGWIPFYHMNEEGIVDFDMNKNRLGSSYTIGKKSNIVKDTMYRYVYLNNDSTVGHFDKQYLGKNSLALDGYYFGSILTKFLQYIDNKMNYGDAKTGKVLSICMDYPVDNQEIYENDEYNSGSSYENAIDKKGFCRESYLYLMYNSVGFIYYYLF